MNFLNRLFVRLFVLFSYAKPTDGKFGDILMKSGTRGVLTKGRTVLKMARIGSYMDIRKSKMKPMPMSRDLHQRD